MEAYTLEVVFINEITALFNEFSDSTVARAATFIGRLAESIRHQVTVKPQRDNKHSEASVGGEAKGEVEDVKPSNT